MTLFHVGPTKTGRERTFKIEYVPEFETDSPHETFLRLMSTKRRGESKQRRVCVWWRRRSRSSKRTGGVTVV